MSALFHISERGDIETFLPREAADGTMKVWAIEARTIANYLLPRECPRVTFRKGSDTSMPDVALLGGAEAVIAIEAAWEQRVREATLFVYGMPPDGFSLADAIAGYWTSSANVIPHSREEIADLPDRIAGAGAGLLILPSLWQLHDIVAASSLDFSMIRMRNARPR